MNDKTCEKCVFLVANESLCGHPFLDTSDVEPSQEACEDYIDRDSIEELEHFKEANKL